MGPVGMESSEPTLFFPNIPSYLSLSHLTGINVLKQEAVSKPKAKFSQI